MNREELISRCICDYLAIVKAYNMLLKALDDQYTEIIDTMNYLLLFDDYDYTLVLKLLNLSTKKD